MMQDFIDKNHNPYEKTMKAEDDRPKLSNDQIEILKELRFENLEINLVQNRIMGALAGSDFETPQPKTRPMTHFEILKLVDSGIYFRCKRTGNVYADWGTNLVIDEWECCLRSDFQKAETLEDVVWKKLEVEI